MTDLPATTSAEVPVTYDPEKLRLIDENPLERAFMARIRADEHRAELKSLQQEFDERCRIHRVRYVEDLPVSVLEEMQAEWGRC